MTRYDIIKIAGDIAQKERRYYMSEYRRLDFSKLHFAETPVSYEEAVKNATPFDVPEGVVSHRKELNITKAEKDYEKRCVKLVISY